MTNITLSRDNNVSLIAEEDDKVTVSIEDPLVTVIDDSIVVPVVPTQTASGFPSGTSMLFQQTAAPVGWTKSTAHNDKILRVVSGAASFGGVNSFSTVNAQTLVGNTTLSIAQMPSHQHLSYQAAWGSGAGTGVEVYVGLGGGAGNILGGPAGGNVAHNHTLIMGIQFVDFIIAIKD